MRFLFALLLFVPSLAFGQLWSGLLNPVDSSFPGALTSPPAYAIPWQGNVGVGGIPARTTICSTIASTGSDQSSAISSALASCASGDTVLLSPAGTYVIASHITIPANVTLRGLGANLTVLNGTGSGAAPVTMGSGSVSYSPITISSGATSGSTALTLASVAGLSTGQYLVVSETNNSSYVTNVGTESPPNCTWCDGWSTNGTRARGQIVEIENIAGSVVTIAPPLYGSYINTPTVVVFSATKLAGIESLQIFANNSGYTNQIFMSECAYCWAKGIEYNYSDGNPIEIDWGYRDEVRDSYISNAFTHVPGNTDSAIFLVLKTSASLVENNIMERQHVGVILNWGAAGNVVAYNYSQGNFDNSQSPGNCNPGTGQCVLLSGFLHHGAHPQFNLWEGNVGEQLYLDSVWGSSSHDTSFRDWMIGTSRICTPYLFGTAGRTTVTTPCFYAFQAARAVQVSQLSNYDNFIGDVVGSSQTNGITGSQTKVLVSPTSRAYDGTVYGFTYGYGESSDSSGNCASTATCTPSTSSLFHGVYSFYGTPSVTWSGSLTHTLPPSFYLASQPAWWTSSGLPFPATGPDVTGGTGPGGFTYGNPAMHCYLSTMGGADGGVGSPLSFNADACFMPGPASPNTQASPFIIARRD